MVSPNARAATLRLVPRLTHERRTAVADNNEPPGAERMFGDVAPALVRFTDDVLFGQVWNRAELSPKERSLVTVARLTTSGNTEQHGYQLGLGKRNGGGAELSNHHAGLL